MSVRLKAPLGWSFSLLAALSAQAQVAATWTGSHDMNATQINGQTAAELIERHPAGGVVATCIVNGFTVINGYGTYADLGVSLVRWSNVGEKLWVRPLVSPDFRIAKALAVDAQGTSYVGGVGDSDFQVIAVDASGAVAWTRVAPGAFDVISDLQVTPAGVATRAPHRSTRAFPTA